MKFQYILILLITLSIQIKSQNVVLDHVETMLMGLNCNVNQRYFRELEKDGEIKNLNINIYHKYIFTVMDIDTIVDSTFINEMRPFNTTDKNCIETYSLIVIGNKLFDGQNGKTFFYPNQEVLEKRLMLFKTAERLGMNFLFGVAGIKNNVSFGIVEDRLVVLKSDNSGIQEMSFSEFLDCCDEDLIIIR